MQTDAMMADTGFVALSGVALGVIGKGVWDWFLAVGRVRADREARAEARREKRIERRDDLQRQTMLELQEVALDLVRAVFRIHLHDAQAIKASGGWGNSLVADDLNEGSRLLFARFTILRSRVRDAELLEKADYLAAACARVATADREVDGRLGRSQASQAVDQLHQRAGILLRTMDNV